MSKTSTKFAATGDDERARAWLLWARGERFAISRVKVGDVELEIAADLSLMPSAPSLASPRPENDPYETYGGPALQRLREQQAEEQDGGGVTVVEDDDGV